MIEYFLVCVVILVLIIYGIKTLLHYFSHFNHQNLKIINLYLERKLINKLLSIITDHSIQDTLEEILDLLKEYYQFEEIVVYNPSNKLTINKISYKNSHLKTIIQEYVNKNYSEINDNLSKNEIIINTSCLSSKIKIFITKVNNQLEIIRPLLIFIEGKNKITSQEIATIVTSIKPLISLISIKS